MKVEIKIYSEEDVVKSSNDIDFLEIKNPIKYYIYFLIKNREIVYVGKSVQPETRIKTHIGPKNPKKRYSYNTKDFDSYTIFECANESEMDMMENIHIVAFTPKLNKAISIKKIGEGIRSSLQKERGEK